MRRSRTTDRPGPSRPGAVLTVCAAALLLLPACRELTAPPESPDEESWTVGSVLILDLEGEPEADVWIDFDGYGFADPPARWNGDTDADGVVRPDVPPGRYTVDVRSREPGPRGWAVVDFALGPGPHVLDPRARLIEGTLTVPDGFDLEDIEIEASTRPQLPVGSRGFTAVGDVAADGTFRLVYPTPGAYDVTVAGGGVRMEVHSGWVPEPGTPLALELVLVEQEVDLQLGGAPLPLASVYVRARNSSGAVEASQFVDDSRIEFWAPPGPGSLEVSAQDGVHFMRQVRAWEFGDGPQPVVELGRDFVEFRFQVSSGAALNGCTMRLSRAEDLATYVESWFGASIGIHLQPGSYAVEASRQGFVTKFQRIEVVGPQVVTITMDPES